MFKEFYEQSSPAFGGFRYYSDLWAFLNSGSASQRGVSSLFSVTEMFRVSPFGRVELPLASVPPQLSWLAKFVILTPL